MGAVGLWSWSREELGTTGRALGLSGSRMRWGTKVPRGTDKATLASGEVLVIRTPAMQGYVWAVYFKAVWLLVNNVSFACQKWQRNCTCVSKGYLVI